VPEQWFHERRVYLDALENQLKALLKAMDTMVSQRKAMAEASGDFSASLHALSTVELSPALSGPLDALSDLQLTIRDVYDRQAQQDVLTFGIILDEYIRLIGSVKQAFAQRQKAFYSWHSAESELQKRRTAQDKLLRQGKSQQDRLNQVSAEVGDAERKVHQARLLFEDMGRLMHAEIDRFEKEKVEDFKSGVETFLESAVEAQKEVSTSDKSSDPEFRAADPDPGHVHSSSRSGRRSSCSWTPRMTRRPSTSRQCTSRQTSRLETQQSTEQEPRSTTIQISL
jgi:sorting nexin-1/2